MTIVILDFKSISFPAGNIAIKRESQVTTTAVFITNHGDTKSGHE